MLVIGFQSHSLNPKIKRVLLLQRHTEYAPDSTFWRLAAVVLVAIIWNVGMMKFRLPDKVSIIEKTDDTQALIKNNTKGRFNPSYLQIDNVLIQLHIYMRFQRMMVLVLYHSF
jgi:hypothetical protein